MANSHVIAGDVPGLGCTQRPLDTALNRHALCEERLLTRDYARLEGEGSDYDVGRLGLLALDSSNSNPLASNFQVGIWKGRRESNRN